MSTLQRTIGMKNRQAPHQATGGARVAETKAEALAVIDAKLGFNGEVGQREGMEQRILMRAHVLSALWGRPLRLHDKWEPTLGQWSQLLKQAKQRSAKWMKRKAMNGKGRR